MNKSLIAFVVLILIIFPLLNAFAQLVLGVEFTGNYWATVAIRTLLMAEGAILAFVGIDALAGRIF